MLPMGGGRKSWNEPDSQVSHWREGSSRGTLNWNRTAAGRASGVNSVMVIFIEGSERVWPGAKGCGSGR